MAPTKNPAADAPYRLITIPFSHYCEKARWGLDRLAIPYREDAYLPLIHYVGTLPVGGRSVPTLVSRAGVFGDSTDILKYLDGLAPFDARLYPDDPARRREVEELEDMFDEGLGPHIRRWVYSLILPERERAVTLFGKDKGALGRLALRAALPVVSALLRKGLNITPESAERSHARTDEAFEFVERRLQDGRRFLVGDSFTAADLTFAALATPTLMPPEIGHLYPPLETRPPARVAEILRYRERPAGAFAMRLYREERRKVVAPS